MAGVLAPLRRAGAVVRGELRAPMRRSQAALIAAAVLGPLLLFAAVGWWSYVRVQDEASEQIERTADLLHEEGLRFFETERYLLQNVDSELLGLTWPEIIERRGRFNALLDSTAAQIPEVEAMFVGDANGITQLSSRASQITATGPTAVNVRDRPYFQKAKNGASLVIDGPLKSRLSGERVVAIVHRLSSADNSFRGIVVVNVDVNRLVRSWRAVTTPGNAVSLVRDDGTFFARYPMPPGETTAALDEAAKERFSHLFSSDSGLFDAAPQGFDGIARRIGFRKLAPFPVYVIYAVAKSNIVGQWYPIAGAFGAIAVAAAAALLFASFAVIRRARGEAAALSRAEATALALSESEEAQRALFRKAPTAMHSLDSERRIIDVNDRWLDLFGYRREEVVGRMIREFYEAADASQRAERWQEILDQGTVLDVYRRCIGSGGARFDALVSATLERDADGRFTRVITTVTDISARRRAEEAARRAQHFAEMLIDSSTDGIIVKDRELRYTVWNPPMEQITGKKRLDVLGHTADGLFPGFRNTAIAQAWCDAIEGRTTTLQDQYFEHFEPRRAGYFDQTVAPLRDAEGTIVGALSIVRDTTERHRLEEVLRQSQKMEAVGQLTGGIAHDFNNLLTVILGNLETVQRRLPAGDVRKFIDSAVRGAERAATLTQRLLAFSRRQPLAPRPLDPNRLVGGMSDLLLRVIGESVAVETVLSRNIWRISADTNQLESAILNLAVNARDAMADSGKLTIATANVTIAAGEAEADPDLVSGQYVMISVSDTGQGMTPEIRAHAFEPFFTTKETGRGSGLGLSQVYGFVKQSGGGVMIGSEPGHGTTVRLYLPRLPADAAHDEAPPTLRVTPAVGRNEAILAVEDDEQVLEHTARLLRELGYRVIEARDGTAALAALERERDVALLFTDVGLPGGLNGRQLAEEAKRRWPNLKVLYTTGYARNAISLDGLLEPGLQLITKPFSYSGLAAKIRDVLIG
ncbi:MAG TPA: PAS domain S-box protein [Stellaceae bacterium]|nr:PAS domain S-box protein [Stellaceae bacterium]